MSQGYVLASVTGVPAVFAIIESHMPLTAALGLPCLLFVVIGYVAKSWPPPKDLRNIEAVCVLSFLFLLITFATVPAFIVLGMPVLDAFFEATSGTTSTGLSVASNVANWPLTGHVLRGWIQWLGGFAIALAGVATIIGPGSAAKKMGEFNFDQQDILTSTRMQARNLLKVYCLITLISFVVLLLVLPTWWEALVITFSAVSTGGFSPRADSLASYTSLAQILVILICLSTTVSMLFYVVLYRSGVKKAAKASNGKAIIITAAIGVALSCALVVLSKDPSGQAMLNTSLNFLSGFSTAGFSVTPLNAGAATTILIIAAMIIGGGAGSTAGGIKIDRAITLFQIVRVAINRMRAPTHAVFKVKENGKWLSSARIMSLIAVLSCYAMTLLICWIIFLVFEQPAFDSLFEIISALSTVGLSTGITGPDTPSFLKFVLICAMLLGRLEFLVLLVTLSPFTWRKRS
jgi:trk system potassium uptake protein TrkH